MSMYIPTQSMFFTPQDCEAISYATKTRSDYPRHAHGGGSVHESHKPDLINLMGAIAIITILHNAVYRTQKGVSEKTPRSINHVQINSGTSGHVPVN